MSNQQLNDPTRNWYITAENIRTSTTSTTDLTITPGTSRSVIINQTGLGGPTGPALKIINSDPGLTGPAIVQYHNTATPIGGDIASNYVTNANVILPSGTLAERMYSNIKTVLTNGSTGPTGPSASISFDLADASATGATGGMSTIMTISGRNPTPYPTFSSSSLSDPQGVQIVTTDNTGSTNRRDIAGLRVQNISNNANGAVIQTVKLRQPIGTTSIGANRDIIGAWSAWGTSSAGFYREYSRIRTQISNAVAGGSIGPDGAVVIAVAENDNTAITPLKDMLRCDGGYALTLPGGPTGPYNLSYSTMVFNPTGASGPQDITGIKAIGNDSFNYGATGQYLISSGPSNTFNWYNGSVYVTGTVASVNLASSFVPVDIIGAPTVTYTGIPSTSGKYKISFNVAWENINSPKVTNDILKCGSSITIGAATYSGTTFTVSSPTYLSPTVAWNTASSPTRYGNNIVFSDIINIGSAVIIGQTVTMRLSVFDEIGSSVQISTSYFVQLEPLYP